MFLSLFFFTAPPTTSSSSSRYRKKLRRWRLFFFKIRTTSFTFDILPLMRDRFLFCFAPFALLWREWQLRSNFSWCSCFFFIRFLFDFFWSRDVARLPNWLNFSGLPDVRRRNKTKSGFKKKGQTIFFLKMTNSETGHHSVVSALALPFFFFFFL